MDEHTRGAPASSPRTMPAGPTPPARRSVFGRAPVLAPLGLLLVATLAPPAVCAGPESTGAEPGELDFARDLSPGVLLCHHPPGLSYTSDTDRDAWCRFVPFGACADQHNDSLATEPIVWYVIAAFGRLSEWCGVEFGLHYPLHAFVVLDHGYCVPSGGLVIPGSEWPDSGTGVSFVTTDQPWQGDYEPVYWFGGYSYASGTVRLRDHPGTPEEVAFTNRRTEQYPARCFGGIGFCAPGIDCCPSPAGAPSPGAD